MTIVIQPCLLYYKLIHNINILNITINNYNVNINIIIISVINHSFYKEVLPYGVHVFTWIIYL